MASRRHAFERDRIDVSYPSKNKGIRFADWPESYAVRVLMVHNYYGSGAPSGENQVFEAEVQMLRARGHDVHEYTRHSDEIRLRGAMGVVKGALATPWNPWSARAVRRAVIDFRPDVVHVHNIFPLISPAIFSAIGRRASRVLTLHNYRLFCPAAIPMRAGQICTECLDSHSALPALKHGCYRGSRVATLPLAASVALHRKLDTWEKHVDAFVALTQFQRVRMVQAGLPAEKVHVKPNFYPGMPPIPIWDNRNEHVVFVGRLSEEKGIRNLIKAWALWGSVAPKLRVVGDGPLRNELERLAKNLPVRFMGQVTAETAQGEIASARLLVLPSECFEGFPMVVREAFAFGTPAAVSNIGPLPSIVRHGVSGVVFEPSNPESLLQEVRRAWETPGLLEQFGKGARAEFEGKYTEEANYATLMDIYERAIAVSRGLD